MHQASRWPLHHHREFVTLVYRFPHSPMLGCHTVGAGQVSFWRSVIKNLGLSYPKALQSLKSRDNNISHSKTLSLNLFAADAS